MSLIDYLAERAANYEDNREIKNTKFDMYIGAFSAILTVGYALCIYIFGLWMISLLCIIPALVFISVAYYSWKQLNHGDENDRQTEITINQ
jgi:uncharacterized membrane protein